MSILTMDMSSHEVDKYDSEASEYDDEILCAGWIPGLALQQSQMHGADHRAAIPEDMVALSVNLFLRKMYSMQR